MVVRARSSSSACCAASATGGDTRVADRSRSGRCSTCRSSTSSSRTCSRRAASTAGWSCLALVAVSIQSIFSLLYYRGLPAARAQETLESLSEHSATIHMNALFIFLLAVWLLQVLGVAALGGDGRARDPGRLGLHPVAAAGGDGRPVRRRRRARRSSLFYRRRRAFWFFAPTAIVARPRLRRSATWNAGGAVGLPAQAVKTVLFPDQLGAADRSSDLYRQIEAFDLWFTIQQNPVTGVGFGQKFLQPSRCPTSASSSSGSTSRTTRCCGSGSRWASSASSSMLFLFARAVQLGARSVLPVRTDEHAAVVVVGLSLRA